MPVWFLLVIHFFLGKLRKKIHPEMDHTTLDFKLPELDIKQAFRPELTDFENSPILKTQIFSQVYNNNNELNNLPRTCSLQI